MKQGFITAMADSAELNVELRTDQEIKQHDWHNNHQNNNDKLHDELKLAAHNIDQVVRLQQQHVEHRKRCIARFGKRITATANQLIARRIRQH